MLADLVFSQSRKLGPSPAKVLTRRPAALRETRTSPSRMDAKTVRIANYADSNESGDFDCAGFAVILLSLTRLRASSIGMERPRAMFSATT